MLVAVKIKLKGNIENAYINPQNYLYAENGKRGDILLFHKNVNKEEIESVNYNLEKLENDHRPLVLSMTLDELASLQGFTKLNVKSKVAGQFFPIVICDHAIKYTRPYIQAGSDKNLFVVYLVGTNNSTITLYTEDKLAL